MTPPSLHAEQYRTRLCFHSTLLPAAELSSAANGSGTGVSECQLNSACGSSGFRECWPRDGAFLQIVAVMAAILGQKMLRLPIVVDTAATPQLRKAVLIE